MYLAGAGPYVEYAARVFFFVIFPVAFLAVTTASAWMPTGGTSTTLGAASATAQALVDAADMLFKVLLWHKLAQLQD